MSWYSEKCFPVINNLFTRSFVNHRKKVLVGARGEVLEIGFGSGLSVACYPEQVKKIVGLEPSDGMIDQMKGELPPKVELVKGSAEDLPFSDQQFDNAVSFFTLCSVKDLDQAVVELKRVLKPGGKLFFIEHAVQPQKNWTRKIQASLAPRWKKLACGCNLTRDVVGSLEKQGFKVLEKKSIVYDRFPNFLSPVYQGIAQKT